jgi:hypothetical protein
MNKYKQILTNIKKNHKYQQIATINKYQQISTNINKYKYQQRSAII